MKTGTKNAKIFIGSNEVLSYSKICLIGTPQLIKTCLKKPTFSDKKECFPYKLTSFNQASALVKLFLSFPFVLAEDGFDCIDLHRLPIKMFCILYDVMDNCTWHGVKQR